MRANLSSCEVLQGGPGQRWHAAAGMLTPRHAFAAAAVPATVCTSPHYTPLCSVLACAPSLRLRVQRVRRWPDFFFLRAQATSPARLYACGGWTYGSKCVGATECCDFPRAGEGVAAWRACAPLSLPRRLHGAAAHRGRIYVFGGSHGNGEVRPHAEHRNR